MESRVANPVGARPGDLVELHLASGNFYTGAAILYLLPVVGVLLGAFLGLGRRPVTASARGLDPSAVLSLGCVSVLPR